MSHALHAYVLNCDERLTEDKVFESMRALFKNSDGVDFSIDLNPFTKQSILKLTIDSTYSVSVFYEQDHQTSKDLEEISGNAYEKVCRIRILFGPDPENDFDDIGVIIYNFLEELEKVVIYSVNQEKILYDSATS
jgi:hypothetical protein